MDEANVADLAGAGGGAPLLPDDERDQGTRPAPGAGEGARQPAGGARHQGRMAALQVLYEVDITDHPVEEVLSRATTEQDLPEPIAKHVARLVRGVLAHQATIDPYIATAAPAFPVQQLAAVDRNVLRQAIFELLNEPDVPVKAAINEAVELAKHFGGDSSGRFVNGVLGTVSQRISAEGGRKAKPGRGRSAAGRRNPARST